ncbi:terminase small subunit [Rhodococcus sp. NPDC004095]
MADSDNQEEKNPVGRPLKYKTVEELDRAISAYFDMCDPHTQRRVVDCGINEKGETIWRDREVMTEQQPYTVSGLARALGIDRDTLINYKKRDEYFGSIQAAYDRCHEYAESQLYGRASAGAAFSLKNNWNWRDKQEHDHTSGGKPIAPVVRIIDERQATGNPDSE